jgi:hypothetical protein
MTAFHPGYCFREGKIRDEKHGEIVSESVSPKWGFSRDCLDGRFEGWSPLKEGNGDWISKPWLAFGSIDT